MSYADIIMVIITGISLAMDAFSVSVSNGLCIKNVRFKDALKVGLFFGIAQGVMPAIGFFVGTYFRNLNFIEYIDHWIAFAILSFIGINMIREACNEIKNPEENECKKLTFKELFTQAVATSIDALAVGISFATLGNINIYFSAVTICVITFILSFFGVYIGKSVGKFLKEKAEIIGGSVLIFIVIKILVEHLFF